MSTARSTGSFMDALEAQGVRFDLREGRLVLDAPAGVLTPALRADITARKVVVEQLVRRVQGLDGPTPRPAPRPTQRCYACRFARWRECPTGGWACGVCHPAPEIQTGATSHEGQCIGGH